MARKITQQQRFINERVRALAIVYLTRRDDLIVAEETSDNGVNLWVTLNPEHKEGHRKFAVALRGSWESVAADQANQALRPSMQDMSRFGPFALPVVVFFFTMRNNEAWYTWASEPVVSATGDFEILQHAAAHCQPLDAAAIDEIIETVDHWYDAFFAKATRGSSGSKQSKASAR